MTWLEALQDFYVGNERTYSQKSTNGTVWEVQWEDHGAITTPVTVHWPCGCVIPVEVVWMDDGRMAYTNWPPPRSREETEAFWAAVRDAVS